MLIENPYKRILIVDDDRKNRNRLKRILSEKGFAPSVVENGRKALEIFTEQPFPIVVTDVDVPEMGGMALLKQIKRLSPPTEVIIISGAEDIDLVVESFRNKAADYLKKPVDTRTLLIAVKTAGEKISINKCLHDYTENLERLVEKKTSQLAQIQRVTTDNNELKSLLNNLPVVIFIIDRHYKITALNNMYKKKFGDFTGSYCYQVTRKNTRPCEECPVRNALKTNQMEQAEIKFLNDKNEEISSYVCASPVPGDNNKSSNMMVISADVSTVQGISSNLSSLGLMVGSVSHGMKGLLTGLDGGVYVLDSALKKHDRKQAVEGLDMVRTVTSKMKNMVLDILFYSRDRELKKEKINSVRFADDLIKIIQAKADKHHISVQQEPAAEEFEFTADPGLLTSALINMVDNAIDACLEDRTKNEHSVGFSFCKNQDNVKITVSDNGIGIDEADIDTVFKLFKSGKGRGGTGLGLFITDKIIKQHGGTISTDSKKGLGTTFSISLPLSYK